MFTISLTPASIGFLAQAMLLIFIASSLLCVRQKPMAAVHLTAFFMAMAGTSVLAWLAVSMRVGSLYLVPATYGMLFLALLFLIQFAYRYPFHSRKTESGIALFLSAMAVVASMAVWVWSQWGSGQPLSVFNPPWQVWLLAIVEGVWAALLLLRSPAVSPGDPAPEIGASWLQTGRKMAWALAALLLSFLLAKVWMSNGGEPGWGFLFVSVVLLWTLFALAIFFLERIPNTITLPVKFIGLSLLTVLTVLSLASWIMVWAQTGHYRADHPFPGDQTFHFERVDDTYRVSAGELSFDDDLGEPLAGVGEGVRQALGFTFPFGDGQQTEVFIHANGAVTFSEQSLRSPSPLLNNQVAAIVPFWADLDSASNGGVFAKQEVDRCVITWSDVALRSLPDSRLTVQLVLYPDGSFDFNYPDTQLDRLYEPYTGSSAIEMAGFAPGPGSLLLEPLRLVPDLDVQARPDTGLMASYALDFRHFVHDLILPQAYFLVIAGLLFGVIALFFLRSNLLAPLGRLLDGLERIGAGDSQITLPTVGNDELGRLNGLFTRLAQSVHEQQYTLEWAQAELEAKLEQTGDQLTAETSRLTEIEKNEQQRRIALENLVQSGLAFSGGFDYNQVLEQVLELLADVIPYAEAEILMLKDQIVRSLYFRRGPLVDNLPETAPHPAATLFKVESDERFKQMLDSRLPLAVADTQVYSEPLQSLAKMRSWLGAPLIYQGHVIAFLSVGAVEPQRYSPDDASYLAIFASQAALALENARLFSEIRSLAVLDTRTGLANRNHFVEMAETELRRARRYQRPITVIRLDIDQFRDVREEHGYLVGNQVLQAVAKFIMDNLRKYDLAGRLSEDRFAILLPETDQPEALMVVERVTKTIAAMPVFTDQGDISITVSAGMVCIVKNYPENVEYLFNQAGQALQVAKSQGGNQVLTWTEEPSPPKEPNGE